MRNQLLALPIIALLVLSGCSSTPAVPDGVKPVSLEKARTEAEKYKGTKIYWGGTILSIQNYPDHSIVEILQRPLSGTEPDDRRTSQGRFMAKVSRFLDPAEFKTPSRLTVTGTLDGTKQGKVGNYPYIYPLVKADTIRFWQGSTKAYDPNPYWGRPYYYPYYRRWPYDPFW